MLSLPLPHSLSLPLSLLVHTVDAWVTTQAHGELRTLPRRQRPPPGPLLFLSARVRPVWHPAHQYRHPGQGHPPLLPHYQNQASRRQGELQVPLCVSPLVLNYYFFSFALSLRFPPVPCCAAFVVPSSVRPACVLVLPHTPPHHHHHPRHHGSCMGRTPACVPADAGRRLVLPPSSLVHGITRITTPSTPPSIRPSSSSPHHHHHYHYHYHHHPPFSHTML